MRREIAFRKRWAPRCRQRGGFSLADPSHMAIARPAPLVSALTLHRDQDDRWHLANSFFSEVKQVRLQGELEIGFAGEDGLQPYVIDEDENTLWVHRPPLFDRTLFVRVSEGKSRFLVKEVDGGSVLDFLNWLGSHTMAQAGVDISQLHSARLQVAIFENPCQGIRVRWSLLGIYQSAHFSMQKGAGKWVQSNFPRWCNFLCSFGWESDAHLLRACEYFGKGDPVLIPEDDLPTSPPRVLPFASASTPALLAMLARMSTSCMKLGGLTREADRRNAQYLLEGVLKRLGGYDGSDFVVTICVDGGKPPPAFVPKQMHKGHRVSFPFRAGSIDQDRLNGSLVAMASAAAELSIANGFVLPEPAPEADHGIARVSITRVFVAFASGGRSSGAAFAQFCMQAGLGVDEKLSVEAESSDQQPPSVATHLATQENAQRLQVSISNISKMTDRELERHLLRMQDSSKDLCRRNMPNGFACDAGTVSRRTTLMGFLSFPTNVMVACAPQDRDVTRHGAHDNDIMRLRRYRYCFRGALAKGVGTQHLLWNYWRRLRRSAMPGLGNG